MAGIAACIVVAGLIYIAVMLPTGKLTATGATAFMLSVLASAVVVAVVGPNTSGLSHLIVKAGEYFSLSADMQQAAVQVKMDTVEVRQIKEQIQTLAQEIAKANADVAQSKQSVAQSEAHLLAMQSAIKQAMRGMLEMYYFDLGTRNFLGSPPKPIIDQMNARFLPLQDFAYNSPAERDAAFQAMRRTIDAVEHPSPTPSAPKTKLGHYPEPQGG